MDSTFLKMASVLGMVASVVSGCVMSAEESIAELDADASMYPAPPSDIAEDQTTETPFTRWKDAAPFRHESNIHLQPCYEAGAECNGDAVCTETQWGLDCMHERSAE